MPAGSSAAETADDYYVLFTARSSMHTARRIKVPSQRAYCRCQRGIVGRNERRPGVLLLYCCEERRSPQFPRQKSSSLPECFNSRSTISSVLRAVKRGIEAISASRARAGRDVGRCGHTATTRPRRAFMVISRTGCRDLLPAISKEVRFSWSAGRRTPGVEPTTCRPEFYGNSGGRNPGSRVRNDGGRIPLCA